MGDRKCTSLALHLWWSTAYGNALESAAKFITGSRGRLFTSAVKSELAAASPPTKDNKLKLLALARKVISIKAND